MEEFLLYNDDNLKIGKVIVYNNFNKKYRIITKNLKYKTKIKEIGTYEIEVDIKNIDDIYDIASKYTEADSIFDEIENIKKNNNIKNVKNPTTIRITIPSSCLKNFKKYKYVINKISELKSKKYFIENVLKNNLLELNLKFNTIVNDFNTVVKRKEFSFYTEDERNDLLSHTNTEFEKLIKIIESNTDFRYGEDFLTTIKLDRYKL